MGQRSQIFVRFEAYGEKYIVARYYQWNYAERMISRVRYGIEWLKENFKYPWRIKDESYRILDTNFDMVDVVISSDILKEYEEYGDEDSLNDFLFSRQDNNDGKALIDVLPDGQIKCAFLDYDNKKIMTAAEYMKWDFDPDWETRSEYIDSETAATCLKNIEAIDKMVSYMSEKEVEEYLEFNYEKSLNK